MATRYLEGETTPTPEVSVSNVFLKRESEIHSHFDLMEKLLQEKRKFIINTLREKRIEFEEMETARLAQIQEIESIKLQMMGVGVKFNKVNILRDQTVSIYDDALEKLKIPIQASNIIFEKFSDKFKKLIDSIDLIFLDEDYTTILEPILSIDRDDILKSIQAMNKKDLAEHEEIEPKPENVGELVRKESVKKEDNAEQITELKLGRMAVDSKTDRVFLINCESNILVFLQDGSLITCFGENLNLNDLCIDSENDFIFALNEDTLVKFNLSNYELLITKKFEEKDFWPIDHHNGDVYAGSFKEDIYVFNSDLEHIKTITTNTIGNLGILCRDEDILIYSLISNGLNIFSYNGDLVNNIPLCYKFGVKDIENLSQEDECSIPFQFYLHKNGLLVICSTFEHSIHIQTLDGTLVHKLVFPPEEDKKIIPAGVASSKDGRIIVSLHISKYPLRYY